MLIALFVPCSFPLQLGWKWTEHRYKDLASYTADDGVIVLSTQSVCIKMEVLIPGAHTAIELERYVYRRRNLMY